MRTLPEILGAILGVEDVEQSRKFPEPKFSNEGLATPIYLSDMRLQAPSWLSGALQPGDIFMDGRPSS